MCISKYHLQSIWIIFEKAGANLLDFAGPFDLGLKIKLETWLFHLVPAHAKFQSKNDKICEKVCPPPSMCVPTKVFWMNVENGLPCLTVIYR